MSTQEDIKQELDLKSLGDSLKQGKSYKDVARPMVDRQKNRIEIDKRALSQYLRRVTADDESEKKSVGFFDDLAYALRSYYNGKDPALSETPWHNAANFPEAITTVLSDTCAAAINDAMFYDVRKLCKAEGEGSEDRPFAPHKEKLINAQLKNQLDAYSVFSMNTHNTIVKGSSFVNVSKDLKSEHGLKLNIIESADIYMPSNVKGVQRSQTDHVSISYALSMQDIMMMMQLKDGGKFMFENLHNIREGWSIAHHYDSENYNSMMGSFNGSSYVAKMKRGTYYLMVTDCTWFHSAGARPIELRVWWIPSTGEVCRYEVNEDKYRLLSDFSIYDDTDLTLQKMSLPKKIRWIQEEATYTTKQIIDASDIAMMPSIFVEANDDFDASLYKRTPGGVYPISFGSNIRTVETNISPILAREQHVKRYYDLATNVSGVPNYFQGVEADRDLTATSDVLRAKKGNMRFANILRCYNDGYRETMNNIDYLNEKSMPKKVAIMILGNTETQTIDQLYPKDENGLTGEMVKTGNINYSMNTRPIDEIEAERKEKANYWLQRLNSPDVQSDPKLEWKVWNEIGKTYNIEQEDVIPKPAGTDILSPEQLINKIMGGAEQVKIDINVDPFPYLEKLQAFKLTLSYKNADFKKRNLVEYNIKIAQLMQKMQEMKQLAEREAQEQQADASAFMNVLQRKQGVVEGSNLNGKQAVPSGGGAASV